MSALNELASWRERVLNRFENRTVIHMPSNVSGPSSGLDCCCTDTSNSTRSQCSTVNLAMRLLPTMKDDICRNRRAQETAPTRSTAHTRAIPSPNVRNRHGSLIPGIPGLRRTRPDLRAARCPRTDRRPRTDRCRPIGSPRLSSVRRSSRPCHRGSHLGRDLRPSTDSHSLRGRTMIVSVRTRRLSLSLSGQAPVHSMARAFSPNPSNPNSSDRFPNRG